MFRCWYLGINVPSSIFIKADERTHRLQKRPFHKHLDADTTNCKLCDKTLKHVSNN